MKETYLDPFRVRNFITILGRLSLNKNCVQRQVDFITLSIISEKYLESTTKNIPEENPDFRRTIIESYIRNKMILEPFRFGPSA